MAFKTLKLITVFALGTVITFSSCKRLFYEKGPGPVVEQSLDLATFTGVDLGGAFDIDIVYGDTPSVVAIGHQNVINDLKTGIFNGIWYADLKHGRFRDYELKIYITSKKINHLSISGSGDITTEGFSNLNSLTTKISGSGDITSRSAFDVNNTFYSHIDGSGNIDLQLTALEHDGEIEGSGNVYLTGEVEEQNIDISGSGDIRAFDFPCKNMNIDISGSGNVETTASESLIVDISGSGNIYYKGNPVVKQNITGSGNVYHKD